jgi:hypothetical protein
LPKNHLSVDVETLRIYEIPLHVKNKRFGLQYHGGNFCVEAVSEAIKRFGTPEIFNTDQGAQFTSEAFTGLLENNGIAISMDGSDRFRQALDNLPPDEVYYSLPHPFAEAA